MLVDRLKIRLGSLATLFLDTDLQEFIDSAISGYSLTEGEDDTLILDIALASCYLRLATDTAKYFQYQQADESVDKSMTPEMFRKLYKDLWESCAARLGIGADGTIDTAKPDTFILRKAEQETSEDE